MGSTRRQRLSGAGAFARLFREGRRLEARHVQVLAAPAATGSGRVGYVIGKHQLARSVDRNYVRRILRETVRRRRTDLDRFDIVVRLRARCVRNVLPGLALEVAGLLDTLVASTRQ